MHQGLYSKFCQTDYVDSSTSQCWKKRHKVWKLFPLRISEIKPNPVGFSGTNVNIYSMWENLFHTVAKSVCIGYINVSV